MRPSHRFEQKKAFFIIMHLCLTLGVFVVTAAGDPVLEAAVTSITNEAAHKFNITYTTAVVSDAYAVSGFNFSVFDVTHGGADAFNRVWCRALPTFPGCSVYAYLNSAMGLQRTHTFDKPLFSFHTVRLYLCYYYSIQRQLGCLIGRNLLLRQTISLRPHYSLRVA